MALRIGHFPATSGNPYIRLLYAALERRGIAAEGLTPARLAGLARRRDGLDVLHLHWNVERLWQSSGPEVERRTAVSSRIGSWLTKLGVDADGRRGLRACERWLQHVKALGLRVVWTVHELEPPEHGTALDREGHALLARSADLLLCHSQHTKREIETRWAPSCPVVVMDIGNYDDVYRCGTDADPAVTRRAFGLADDRPVVALLGKLRPYKGVDIACRAIRELNGAVQLVVGGRATSPDVMREIEEAASGSSAIRIVGRTLTADEFCQLGRASDLFVLPYRAITGSSVVMAAFTLGCAVVATDLPFFRELAARFPGALRLAPPGDPGALAHAISEMLRVPADDRRRVARAVADHLTWDTVVEPYARWLAGVEPYARWLATS